MKSIAICLVRVGGCVKKESLDRKLLMTSHILITVKKSDFCNPIFTFFYQLFKDLLRLTFSRRVIQQKMKRVAMATKDYR